MERKTIQYAGKDLEVIIPDEEWMREKYSQFRAMFFSDGFMPESIRLNIDNSLKHSWGVAEYWDSKMGDSGMFTVEKSRIRIPPEYVSRNSPSMMWLYNGTYPIDQHPMVGIKVRATKWLPEEVYENTMVHEMCHVFCYLNGLWTGGNGHDGYFMVLSKKIGEASGGKYKVLSKVSDEEHNLCSDINDHGFVATIQLNGSIPYAFRDTGIRPVSMKSAVNPSPKKKKAKEKPKVEPHMLFYWFEDEMDAKAFISNAIRSVGSLFGKKPTGVWAQDGKACLPKVIKACIFKTDVNSIKNRANKPLVNWIRERCVSPENGVPLSINNTRLANWSEIMIHIKALINTGALIPYKYVNAISESADLSEERRMSLVVEGMMDSIRGFWKKLMHDIKEVMASLRREHVVRTEHGWEVA